MLTEFEILNEHCQRACLDSRGEICAADFFDELNIEYQAMKRFDDFEYALDFYLPAYNIGTRQIQKIVKIMVVCYIEFQFEIIVSLKN